MPTSLHRIAVRPRLIEEIRINPPSIPVGQVRSLDTNVPGVDGSMVLSAHLGPTPQNGLMVVGIRFIGGSAVRIALLNSSSSVLDAPETTITVIGW